MSTDATLTWTETRPGLWCSTDGRYAIVRAELPEPLARRTVTWTLRKIDPDSARAYLGTLGYFRAERYSLGDAQAEAERDAYCETHASERHISEDYPALALTRFFWPISEGITKAGLAICRDGDRVVARVVGMARGEDAFEPVTYAEIDISGQQGLALSVFEARSRTHAKQRAERSKKRAAS